MVVMIVEEVTEEESSLLLVGQRIGGHTYKEEEGWSSSRTGGGVPSLTSNVYFSFQLLLTFLFSYSLRKAHDSCRSIHAPVYKTQRLHLTSLLEECAIKDHCAQFFLSCHHYNAKRA